MLRNREGFTLIELLIVVVIIGILAAVAIPKFSSTRNKAYISQMKSDLRNLQTAQEVYYSTGNNYEYAGDVSDLSDFSSSQGVTVVIGDADGNGWNATASHSANPEEGGQVVTCGVYVGEAGAPDGIANLPVGVVGCSNETF